jgi:hypothetical protein
MRILNGKPDKKEFMYCVSLLKNMHINLIIAGKLKLKDEKFYELVDKISSKIPIIDIEESRDIPSSLNTKQGVSEFPTIKSSSYKQIFISDFIQSETKFPVSIYSCNIIIYHKKWRVLSEKITEKKIKSYIEKKYKKLGDKFIPMIIYDTLSKALLDSKCLLKLFHDSPTISDAGKYISSAFNI